MSSACFHFPTKIMNSRNSSFSSFNVVHTSVYLFVCLSVRVKHIRDYHSMYLSRGFMFNFLLEQIAQLLSFNLFFSFNRLSWIFFFFFSKDNCKLALCFGNQKQEKGKEWIVNKILQGFLVFQCSFYEICIWYSYTVLSHSLW